MKGVLSVEQQMAVLAKIWGPDREGYVFVPWIDGRANDKKARRASYHEGPAFEWPGDRPKIIEWLAQHPHDDVYFAPCLFEDKRRIEQAAAPERTLWADLDEVDPREIDEERQPSIAWESSPGRYQGVWLLDRPRIGLSWAGDINHRLTMSLGADPSGWDTTQLLRVPGRPNHKFDYRTDPTGSVRGQLLWDTGRRHFLDDEWWAQLPEVGVVDVAGGLDLMDASVIGAIDRHEVWGRVRLKMPKNIREYMAVRTGRQADDIGKDVTEGRSGVQWQIMRELAKAGCTVAEIVAVVQHTVWNTYQGRSDELKRLKIGAAKAVGSKSDDEGDEGEVFEEVGVDKPTIAWLSDVMGVSIGRPRWLVHNIWSENGCGFIAGDPKSYKSWTGLDLAVTVATGGHFLNDPGMAAMGGPRPFLYLQEEDSPIVVRDRMENVVEGKCPHLHWHGRVSFEGGSVFWSPADGNIPIGFHVRAGFIASDVGWQQWLADMLAEHQFAGVVIDTLGTTAGDVDTDRAQDLMTKILRPMREISHQTSTAIAVVHHNRKGSSNGERGGSRMLGSVALHAWVDDAMYLHSRESKAGGVTKIRVERESKSSTEHRFVLEVPTMGIRPGGVRTFWEPTVGLWDTSEGGTDGESTPIPHGPNGNRKVAGTDMMWKVKRSGGNEKRPTPLDRIASQHDMTLRNVRKQIASALENGLVKGDLDTGVWVD